MRILFFGNNLIGWKIAEWLRAQGDTIAGVVLHPPGKRKYGDEIIQSTGVDPAHIVDGSRLREPDVIAALRALKADIGVSALFGYILRRDVLDLLPAGCVNIHPALLPYNRGSYPNVWSIVEGTPSGVTIHYIDEGVDTGDIIAQCTVPVEPVDTGESLYRKLEQASLDLFQQTWPRIRAGQAPRLPQIQADGTTHRIRDAERIDEIDLNRTYTGKELIDILRARTFPPYRSAYFWHDGRKVYVRVQLEYDDSQ